MEVVVDALEYVTDKACDLVLMLSIIISYITLRTTHLECKEEHTAFL